VSLSAAVFRNIKNLEQEFGIDLFEVTDPQTGEAELKPDATISIPRQLRFAQKKRIGNIAAVAGLRKAVRAIFPNQNCIIMEKVIYDGIHGGDQIDLDLLPQLRAEVERLKEHDAEGVPEFVLDMLTLIEAAEQERNPIVFI
jgi:hypothetical protein